MMLFAADPAAQRGVRQAAPPSRAPSAPLQTGQGETQRGIQRDGEESGDQHREALGIGERMEEPAFLTFQGEHREEGDRHNEEREKRGAADFFHRVQDDALRVAPAAFALPLLQFLVSLLDDHDGRIDQRAGRDGNASQRHHVEGHSHEVERHGHGQHGERNGEDGDGGAGRMPEEQQDDDHDGDDDLDERGTQRGHDPMDEIGAVVDGNHADAGRQSRGDLLQLGLDAIDEVHDVRALPHDDNSGDGFPLPVEIGHAAAHFRADGHAADILHADCLRGSAACHDRLFQVTRVLQVTVAADHELGAAELQETAAGFDVAPAHRFDHGGEWDSQCAQACGIRGHLVLRDESAHRSHFGHSRNRAQVIAQEKVLRGPQLGGGAFPGVVCQGILKDPAQRGSIRTKFGFDAGRQGGEYSGKILQGSRTRPVQVGSVFEDDVDEGIAEIGNTAHGLDLRRPQHRGDDGVGHLVFDEIRTAIPA